MAATLAQSSEATAPPPLAVPPVVPASLTGTSARPLQATRTRPIPLEKFVIDGGVPLSGTITPAGNKNGALPILAACLLTDDEVILRNVPRIADVQAMVTLLETLGARIEWIGAAEVAITAATVDSTEPDRTLAERIRASFLLAGPLLARFGRACMPPPGGDVIGRRRLDPHLDAFCANSAHRSTQAGMT
jgi:UDP-N-acetylglucosamine 1-carboxyvinyltransferase